MKRVLSWFLVTLVLLCTVSMGSISASASNEKGKDDVREYRIENNYAVLTGVSEVQTGLKCGPPSFLGGYPLKIISGINCGAIQGIRTSEFVIPQGVEKITGQAFNTGGFSTVIMPLSLKEIGFNAFVNCYQFNTVYYEGTNNDWGKISPICRI